MRLPLTGSHFLLGKHVLYSSGYSYLLFVERIEPMAKGI